MLNSYLEDKIQNQVTVLNALLEFKELSIKELLNITKLSDKTAIQILLSLQDLFGSELTINLRTDYVYIEDIIAINKLQYYHKIYQQSSFLKLVSYFASPKKESFSAFALKHYISRATAYRLKAKCESFLKIVGLSLRKNRIVGPEYRIRCLIALLDYRYGYQLYDFHDGSLDIVLELIVASNDCLTRASLEKTPDDYLFFATLIAIGLKRKNENVNIPKTALFNSLKQIFIYQQLCDLTTQIIEPAYNTQFSKDDLDYFMLSYCISHSAFCKDKWRDYSRDSLYDLISSTSRAKGLIKRYQNLFGKDIVYSRMFRSAVVFTAKNFLFDLQGLIPNYYFFTPQDDLENPVLRKIIQTLLLDWMTENHIGSHLNPNSLSLLTLQLQEIIKSNLKPIPVYICQNNIADLLSIQSILQRNFSDKLCQIHILNTHTDIIPESIDKEGAILLCDQQYHSYLDSYLHNPQHIVINLSINLKKFHKDLISDAIKKLQYEKYAEYLRNIQTKFEAQYH
ncbi:helix-turn-helix domain-containing protein [Streptococcus ovis]|uniref:helix-turn-helix domain-containing protein n=1 Tax=Streptococcus ovis TaxID=82806 RepID=UPI000361A16A|nr:helix-turn-helix domain-containing protein [Streptococcus ovis]